MKLLMIDNYDSFTFNLVQYFGELGAEVAVVRNDETSLQDIAERTPDRLVISPGPCSPKEAGISVEAIRHFASRRPCQGMFSGLASSPSVSGASGSNGCGLASSVATFSCSRSTLLRSR